MKSNIFQKLYQLPIAKIAAKEAKVLNNHQGAKMAAIRGILLI